jgi:hypothetical protein
MVLSSLPEKEYQDDRSTAEEPPPPAVHTHQANGSFLLAHGEPHDPCPVEACRGILLFLHR